MVKLFAKYRINLGISIETLEWLSNDIFGKVVHLKKGVTNRSRQNQHNLNESMNNFAPTRKISDMTTGWICG
jgi:hypothetical protein